MTTGLSQTYTKFIHLFLLQARTSIVIVSLKILTLMDRCLYRPGTRRRLLHPYLRQLFEISVSQSPDPIPLLWNGGDSKFRRTWPPPTIVYKIRLFDTVQHHILLPLKLWFTSRPVDEWTRGHEGWGCPRRMSCSVSFLRSVFVLYTNYNGWRQEEGETS